MRTISYSDIQRGVCERLGWDSNNLDAQQFQAIRGSVSRALLKIWDKFWWSGLVLVEERPFRLTYNALTAYAAGDEVYHVGSQTYYQALRSTTGNAPATLSGSTWSENSAYWVAVGREYSASPWDSTVTYAVGGKALYQEDLRVYQRIVAGTGELPTDATKWGIVNVFDQYVDPIADGYTAIGRVRAVWNRNPRVWRGAARVEWSLTDRGIEVETNLPTVWVEFLERPHRFNGDAYSASAAYTAENDEDVSGNVTSGGPALTDDTLLREWTAGGDYTVSSATRDTDGLITTASVVWPDGSAGVFTTTLKNSTFLTIDAYTITHVQSGKTATQAAVTRDLSGNVIAQPAITIT